MGKKTNKAIERLSDDLLCEKITDYKTVREANKWWALLALFIPLPFFLIHVTFVIMDNEPLGDFFLYVILYFAGALGLFLYCRSFKLIQKKFILKGRKYDGCIVKAE